MAVTHFQTIDTVNKLGAITQAFDNVTHNKLF